jgi:hypothetical protein
VRSTLAQIEGAFGDAPRPSNEDLLHERCMDDNDIARLYPVAHWRELPDELSAYMGLRCATWAAVPPPSPPKGAQRGRNSDS